MLDGGSGALACLEDAGLGDIYSKESNDPRCPAQWGDLTNGGIPNECTVNGLICTYPQGQAVCAPDGQPLKWAQNGAGPGTGCSEYPPTLCSPCSVPGNICEYIKGPGPLVSDFVATFCCNGNTKQWEVQANNAGCPNGNVCGTISTSNYDQRCTTDTDCTGVTQGDLCTMGCTNCVNGAINANALAQYNADFAKKVSVPRVCPCPSGPALVCNAGMCSLP
jgi:hypothetical protein